MHRVALEVEIFRRQLLRPYRQHGISRCQISEILSSIMINLPMILKVQRVENTDLYLFLLYCHVVAYAYASAKECQIKNFCGRAKLN